MNCGKRKTKGKVLCLVCRQTVPLAGSNPGSLIMWEVSGGDGRQSGDITSVGV